MLRGALSRLLLPCLPLAARWERGTVSPLGRCAPTIALLASVVGCSSPTVDNGGGDDTTKTSLPADPDAGPIGNGSGVSVPDPPPGDLLEVPGQVDAGPACGNSQLEAGESCDDGNTVDGDGCSSSCELDDNFICQTAGAPCTRATVCGDGRQTGREQCDDGDTVDGDGCSATCLIEANFACIEPGQPCVSTVACGDAVIAGDETCDDGNANDGDGCSASCQTESGWLCGSAGFRCQAVCGDGLLVGRELCDDGNTDDGDGCSGSCRVEPGYACDTANEPCHETVCGDGITEGDEPCDDGSDIHVGDGCSPGCKLEPVCAPATAATETPLGASDDADGGLTDTDSAAPAPGVDADAGLSTQGHATEDAGTDGETSTPPSTGPSAGCSSSCGDGLLLAGDEEACDDGNSQAGDGCDDSCQIESGWSCTLTNGALPEELVLPVVYRDFIHNPSAEGTSPRHPDFERYSGSGTTYGLVAPLLATDGRPVYTGICEAGQTLDPALCPYNEQTTSQADFDQWYRDTPEINIPILDSLTFVRQPDNTYVFDGQGGMFPLDNLGWVATTPPAEDEFRGHNFGFTTELRYWFEYRGGEFLEFEGDDDVWVFVAGQLAVDIGGLHPSRTASVTLDGATAANLGLQVGRVYEIALFHAERHTDKSNFKLTIGGFVSAETSCSTECGDGIVAGDEQCDDGENNGKGYGFCNSDCTPGERCGDSIVNGDEVCDNGINLSGYINEANAEACAPGCVLPASCGDGRLDTQFGEQCDEGVNNTGEYDGCNEDCTLGPRCGDGTKNGDEQCDDGNLSNRDSCSVECTAIVRPVAK